ncbi:MAG TPA: hypothetical protein P5525_13920, partial [Candidatus Paceibacterota bacterium]|nr:hypothetical protein [Candidatus Paceibacterota bacterium]
MQVTSLISRDEAVCDHCHDHHDHHGHAHHHEHIPVKLSQTLIGMIFIINSYLLDLLFPGSRVVASFSAMIGAVILGAPIIMTSFRDLSRGSLSINEL